MSNHADSCTDFRALASCHLDGELDELQTARLERHLDACAECASWLREVTALAGLLHESEPLQPAWALELRSKALRRRVVRGAMLGATAASAAAVAAFAIALPGGLSLSSSGPQAAAPPCASCTKKQAVTYSSQLPAVAPVHVAHPFVERT